MSRMIWRDDFGLHRCCCGCRFTSMTAAREHDQLRCMDEDRAEASVAWMLAAVLCACAIVAVTLLLL